MRWRVERAGSPGAWLPGWIAHVPEVGYGALLATWTEAMEFVAAQIRQHDLAAVGEPCS